jgi:hypothetical protein
MPFASFVRVMSQWLHLRGRTSFRFATIPPLGCCAYSSFFRSLRVVVDAAENLKAIFAAEHTLDVFIESLPSALRVYHRLNMIDGHSLAAEGLLAFHALIEVAN